MNSQYEHNEFRKRVESQFDANKNRLRQSVVTRLKTSFIFAIAEIEDKFGHLWNPDSQDDEVEGPEYYKSLFLELRKRVLDNGNAQIRAFEKDLEGYKEGNRNG